MSVKDATAAGSEARRKFLNLKYIGLGAVLILAGGTLVAQTTRPGAPANNAPPATPRLGPAPATATTTGQRNPAPAAAPSSRPPLTTQNVMAVINSEQLTRQELAYECLRRYGSEVLESMVNKRVIAAACAAKGITITNQDVTEEIKRLSKKFGNVTPDLWLSMLERERGISENEYRNDIIWPALAMKHLAAKEILISPREMQQAFENEYGPRVKARIIAVSQKKKADEIHAKVSADPDSFGEYAKNHSEDISSASAHGLIPPIRRHGDKQYALIEETAFSLKPGEVSPVMEVAQGQYIILKCDQQLPKTYIAPANLKDAQERLNDQLHDQKLREISSKKFEELQAQARVVNVYNNEAKRKEFPGVAALINDQPIKNSELAEECIRRHGIDVLDGEINRKILTQELKRRKLQITQQDIQDEIARAAISYGFIDKDGNADIATWEKKIEENDGGSVELYVADAVWPSVALKLMVADTIEVTKDDLQKGYQANYGELVEARAIVLDNNRKAQQVWEQARSNDTEEWFATLAEQYSIEPVSRGNGGLVPPIRMHGGQPKIEAEAFKLQPGQLSSIIAIDDKFVILRCIRRKQPIVKDFNAVKDDLQRDIYEKKLRVAMATEFDRLRTVAQVDNFLAGTSQSGKPIVNVPSKTDANVRPAAATRSAAPVRQGALPTRNQ